MKKLLVAALAAGVSFGLLAEEAAEVEEQDSGYLLEYGVDIDIPTAYVWRNAVQFDRPVVQVSPWIDWTVADLFWVGGYVWQNYDLNNGRHDDGLRGEWNETDFNLHIASDVWTSDDEESKLTLELGNEWYVYDSTHATRKDYPTTYEVYFNAELANPYVTPYGKIAYDYKYVDGFHYELGLKKEATLEDVFGKKADWMSKVSVYGDLNVNFGSRRYLGYLYGCDIEDTGDLNHGIGGTTAKAGLAWAPVDWCTVRGYVAFTSVLDDAARENVRGGSTYCDETDFVWGGIQIALAF